LNAGAPAPTGSRSPHLRVPARGRLFSPLLPLSPSPYLLLLAAVILAIAATAGAQVNVTIEPAADQGDAPYPYRLAAIQIATDATDQAFSEIRVRSAKGGPEIRAAGAIPPRTPRTTLTLPLPALSVQQVYDVHLLAEDSSVAGHDATAPGKTVDLQVTVNWLPEQVNEAGFIDRRLYDDLEDDLPPWPAQLRQVLFLTMVGSGLALAMTILMRPGPLRLSAMLVVLAATAGVSWWCLEDTPLVQTRIVDCPAAHGQRPCQLYVVTSRRTAQWADKDAVIVPVYYDAEQMANDTTIVQPGVGITSDISPNRVHLFKRF
jgi:hypothetical protein